MKTYALSLIVFLLLSCNSSAEIKNGYEIDIKVARESLKNINALLITDNHLTQLQIAGIKNQIEIKAEFITNYELTTRLLAEFRKISPAIYDEINFIRDHEGRTVDVYVKFMDGKNLPEPIKATTNLEHAITDKNAYYSEYGFNTVSVKVSIERKSLWFLAHEFGHISYLVPNLAIYFKRYLNHYKKAMHKMGHGPHDPSGQMAVKYEVRFRNCYNTFFKSTKDHRKSQAPSPIPGRSSVAN